MKKIRLDLEQLSVESFATERNGGAEKGTVRGHDSWPSWYECTSRSGLEMCICQEQIGTNVPAACEG